MEEIPMYTFKANHCWYLTPQDPCYQAAVCEDVQHTSTELLACLCYECDYIHTTCSCAWHCYWTHHFVLLLPCRARVTLYKYFPWGFPVLKGRGRKWRWIQKVLRGSILKLPAGRTLAVKQDSLWVYVNSCDEFHSKIVLSLHRSRNQDLFPAPPSLHLGRKISLHKLIFGEMHHCLSTFNACLCCTYLLCVGGERLYSEARLCCSGWLMSSAAPKTSS